MNKFAERLKVLRLEKGINQTQLGKQLGYGYTAIANYENGRNEPSFDTLIKLSNYFGVTVDYLLGNDSGSSRRVEISTSEQELIKCYREMTPEGRRALLVLLKSFQK